MIMNDIEYRKFEKTCKYVWEDDKNRIKELGYKLFKEGTSSLAIGLYGRITFISLLSGNINANIVDILMAMNQTKTDQNIIASNLKKKETILEKKCEDFNKLDSCIKKCPEKYKGCFTYLTELCEYGNKDIIKKHIKKDVLPLIEQGKFIKAYFKYKKLLKTPPTYTIEKINRINN